MKQAGAPSYPVLTGRRDGFVSIAASVDLPSPSVSWESALAYFESKGLNELDMVTLLGACSFMSCLVFGIFLFCFASANVS